MAGWDLPPAQKAALTSCGVPLLDDLVDVVLLTVEPGEGKYRLAGTGSIPNGPGYVYLAEPGSGVVSALEPPSGHLRFVNSSVNHWLCSLHLVGTWFSGSAAIQSWDEDEEAEQAALAELSGLLKRITDLDPPAYGGRGDHDTHFWPAVIDRWLY